jgi:hypothetical protein
LVQNKILDHEMREFIRHHPARMGRTRVLLEILPRRGPEVFHAFCCTLLSFKRDDLVKVLTKPDTRHGMCFPEQSVKVLTNPDTEDMEMRFPEQSSFHLGSRSVEIPPKTRKTTKSQTKRNTL